MFPITTTTTSLRPRDLESVDVLISLLLLELIQKGNKKNQVTDVDRSSAKFYETGEDEFGIMPHWMA
jgi:hypothetical protein